MKKATIAPVSVLGKYGAETFTENEGNVNGLVINGWKFSSFHDKICNSKDLLKLARNIESIVTKDSSDVSISNNSLNGCEEVTIGHNHHHEHSDHIHISGYSLHLPPMLFLNDYMNIEHISSNIAVHLCPSDSLTAWAAKHSDNSTSRHPLDIAQVPYAHTWTNQSLPQVTEKIDKSADEQTGHRNSGKSGKDDDKGKWDWTFSSDYCCTLRRRSTNKIENSIITATLLADEFCHCTGEYITSLSYTSEPLPRHGNSASLEWQWRWERATQSGLDMTLLRRTDVDAPILFYDEFLLYQDDLEDCGEVSMEVKVRVMPTCWFALIRCFLRVDDMTLQMKETRLFHSFSSSANQTTNQDVKIHAVISWKELSLAAKEQQSHPVQLARTVLRNPNELSEKLPIINDKLNIPQFCTLQFTSTGK